MEATRPSPGITRYDTVAVPTETYGVITYLYAVMVALVTAGFFITQLLVNGVRDGTLPTAVLDQWLFPGAYWWVATTGMAFLLLSGLFAGVTPAILVVRAFMHVAPCGWYVVLFMLQCLAWAYFLSIAFS